MSELKMKMLPYLLQSKIPQRQIDNVDDLFLKSIEPEFLAVKKITDGYSHWDQLVATYPGHTFRELTMKINRERKLKLRWKQLWKEKIGVNPNKGQKRSKNGRFRPKEAGTNEGNSRVGES